MIFVDKNNIGERDKDEPRLKYLSLLKEGEKLVWRSFGSKPYLSFDTIGTTGYQSGRIALCANSSYSKKVQIIVYRTGRARKAKKSELKEMC